MEGSVGEQADKGKGSVTDRITSQCSREVDAATRIEWKAQVSAKLDSAGHTIRSDAIVI